MLRSRAEGCKIVGCVGCPGNLRFESKGLGHSNAFARDERMSDGARLVHENGAASEVS